MERAARLVMRGRVILAGAVLLAGLLVAPLLSLRLILPVSLVWYLALLQLLKDSWRVLSLWVGRGVAIALLSLALATPVLLTAVRPRADLAVWLPCPRNWEWLPAWLLRSSPLGSLRFPVAGSRVRLCYGRPAARGRRMLGGSAVPYGQLWRTGANEPTILISSIPLEVAGLNIPAGRTALYTVPGPETWELILNSATSQWGLESEYTSRVRARELGRAILRSSAGPPVERLQVLARPEAPADFETTVLVLAWEQTRLRIPIRASRAEPSTRRYARQASPAGWEPLRP